jgi:hypothetical protein
LEWQFVAAPAAAEIGTGARARRSPRRRQTEANMWARWIEVVLVYTWC